MLGEANVTSEGCLGHPQAYARSTIRHPSRSSRATTDLAFAATIRSLQVVYEAEVRDAIPN